MRIKTASGPIYEKRVGIERGAQAVRVGRAAIGEIEIPIGVAEEKVVVYDDAAAGRCVGANAVMAVLVEDIVLDIDAIQSLPQYDSVGAIIRDDIVVHFQIAHRRVAG